MSGSGDGTGRSEEARLDLCEDTCNTALDLLIQMQKEITLMRQQQKRDRSVPPSPAGPTLVEKQEIEKKLGALSGEEAQLPSRHSPSSSNSSVLRGHSERADQCDLTISEEDLHKNIKEISLSEYSGGEDGSSALSSRKRRRKKGKAAQGGKDHEQENAENTSDPKAVSKAPSTVTEERKEGSDTQQEKDKCKAVDKKLKRKIGKTTSLLKRPRARLSEVLKRVDVNKTEVLLEAELDKVRYWERKKSHLYFWMQLWMVCQSFVNFIIIPFRLAFLLEEPEFATIFLVWDVFFYSVNIFYIWVAKDRFHNEHYRNLTSKLANSYISDSMRKLQEKFASLPVVELANLLSTFPETDDTSLADLMEFVSSQMDLNSDGNIGRNNKIMD